jgi:hypothetical protein
MRLYPNINYSQTTQSQCMYENQSQGAVRKKKKEADTSKIARVQFIVELTEAWSWDASRPSEPHNLGHPIEGCTH